ncbi:unnamed protein product [Caretta caretta]
MFRNSSVHAVYSARIPSYSVHRMDHSVDRSMWFCRMGHWHVKGLWKDLHQELKLHENSGKMVIRLRRITPGYIRLLQTQAAGKIVINTTDILMQRTALLLGMFGISISGYSTRRLTQEKRLPLNL